MKRLIQSTYNQFHAQRTMLKTDRITDTVEQFGLAPGSTLRWKVLSVNLPRFVQITTRFLAETNRRLQRRIRRKIIREALRTFA